MYIILKSEDYDGDNLYNVNSIKGIYENFVKAKKDILEKLSKKCYEYEILLDDTQKGKEYLFVRIMFLYFSFYAGGEN